MNQQYPAAPLSTSGLLMDLPGLRPPAWVDLLLGPYALRSLGPDEEMGVQVTRGDRLCLVSLRVRSARRLDRAAFRAATARAYRRLEGELRGRGLVHPVRLWNHIPAIHEPLGDGQDRYMVFNAGRYDALAEWLGRESFDTRIAAASGVGHDGDDLVIHCLAADRPGRAVDNPRQVAPYRYSRRYGPLPPCFARATVCESPAGEPLVLVGGTASIVGEESVHLDDLSRQVDETLNNLAVLVRAAAGDLSPDSPQGAERAAALACYRDVRVYYLHPDHLSALRDLLASAFPRAGAIQWVRADICRAELLVEIEGVATGGSPSPGRPLPAGRGPVRRSA